MENSKYCNIKINVKNEENSTEIQKCLFSKGCKWEWSGQGVSYTDCAYLYVDSRGGITYGNNAELFKNTPYKEVTFDIIRKVEVVMKDVPKEVVVLNGKKYYKEDLEVALQNIKEVI